MDADSRKETTENKRARKVSSYEEEKTLKLKLQEYEQMKTLKQTHINNNWQIGRLLEQ